LVAKVNKAYREKKVAAHSEVIDALHIHMMRIKQKGAGFPTPFRY
jgi:hypothetical protein